MLKKDKEKVIDEVWTEERVRSFLDIQAPAGVNHDFHRLLKAYQSMRADDFELFVGMALAANLDLNDKNSAGQTVADIASQHRHGTNYVAIIERNIT